MDEGQTHLLVLPVEGSAVVARGQLITALWLLQTKLCAVTISKHARTHWHCILLDQQAARPQYGEHKLCSRAQTRTYRNGYFPSGHWPVCCLRKPPASCCDPACQSWTPVGALVGPVVGPRGGPAPPVRVPCASAVSPGVGLGGGPAPPVGVPCASAVSPGVGLRGGRAPPLGVRCVSAVSPGVGLRGGPAPPLGVRCASAVSPGVGRRGDPAPPVGIPYASGSSRPSAAAAVLSRPRASSPGRGGHRARGAGCVVTPIRPGVIPTAPRHARYTSPVPRPQTGSHRARARARPAHAALWWCRRHGLADFGGGGAAACWMRPLGLIDSCRRRSAESGKCGSKTTRVGLKQCTQLYICFGVQWRTSVYKFLKVTHGPVSPSPREWVPMFEPIYTRLHYCFNFVQEK